MTDFQGVDMEHRTCRHCDGPLVGRRNLKYCSPKCKHAAAYAKRKRTPCDICGGPTGWAATWKDSATCQECRRSRFDHGTRKGYRDHGCRCHLCSEWAREAARAYRQKRRLEGRPLPGNCGPWIAPSVRLWVFERDGWKCQLCGGDTDRDADPQSDWYPSLDHVVPQSKGGGHEPGNLRTAHRWCNSIRGSEDYHSYLFEEAS